MSPFLTALSARLMRSGMLEVLRQDYIRTAYAKGLIPHVVFTRHALRNALIPVIAMAGLSFAFLIGSSIVIEVIFAWPGIGQLVYWSILVRDYNVVLGIVVITTVSYILVNLLVDIITGYIDPRIGLRGRVQ